MPTLQEFNDESIRNTPAAPVILSEPVPVDELPTPALIIDLDVFDANLAKMQNYLAERDMGLRCHSKMHKCPIIAHKQIAAGAIGICAAKVGEAEIMQANGVNNILITSPVVSPETIQRVIKLAAENTDLQIVMDDVEVASRFNDTAKQAGVTLGVLIDLDPAMGRTGIETGEPALALGRHLMDECQNLRFDGLQMYAGHCMHIEGFDARKEKYLKVMQAGADTREMFTDADIEVGIFSGGGTGTFNIEPNLGLITDLQAGSYVFMDIEYRDIGGEGTELFVDFEPSLFVLVTAISKPQQRLITVDAGFKSFASDKMSPEFRDVEGVTFHFGGDEHGIIQLTNPSQELNLGDKLPMLTPHCDPTVNLHDYYYPVRNGVVEELWPISARGRSQ
ncbi:MAG: DSD1 family PLP-dependent enzyme [Pseudomonadales bacterium]